MKLWTCRKADGINEYLGSKDLGVQKKCKKTAAQRQFVIYDLNRNRDESEAT